MDKPQKRLSAVPASLSRMAQLVELFDSLDLTETEQRVKALEVIAKLGVVGYSTEVAGKEGVLSIVVRNPEVSVRALSAITDIQSKLPPPAPQFTINVIELGGDYAGE